MPSDALSLEQVNAMRRVLAEVEAERVRQHAKWGEQNLPDFVTEHVLFTKRDELRRARNRFKVSTSLNHPITYEHVLTEEFWEAMNERDPAKLRAELLQVAAVCVQWCEAIDRRSSPPARVTEDSEVAR